MILGRVEVLITWQWRLARLEHRCEVASADIAATIILGYGLATAERL